VVGGEGSERGGGVDGGDDEAIDERGGQGARWSMRGRKYASRNSSRLIVGANRILDTITPM